MRLDRSKLAGRHDDLVRNSCLSWIVLLIISSTTWAQSGNETKLSVDPTTQQFFKTHCFACHQGKDAEAGLDLSKLSPDLNSAEIEQRWVRIHDRVKAGEMPPPEAEKLSASTVGSFLQPLAKQLREHHQMQIMERGRVHGRRLTRRELERSLQDILGIDIPLIDFIPEESSGAGFSTVAEGQSISHFDVERHLTVVDIALDEAIRRALVPQLKYDREFDARAIARRNPNARNREPEMRDGKAVIWNGGVIYYGRTPVTTAPEDGWYRFQLQISGLKLPESGGVWTTVYSGPCVSSAPILNWVTAFEVDGQPQVIGFDAWILKGHMLEIRPGDITLKRARFLDGQVGAGEAEDQNVPGIAMDWIRMKKVHLGLSDEEIRKRLFGDIPVSALSKGKEGAGRKTDTAVAASEVTRNKLDELMVSLATRAFRRPVALEEIGPYCELVHAARENNENVVSALRTGYRALLCSPRFLYFTESAGQLDSFSLASRLSYMLTGSLPDAELWQLAVEGKLNDPNLIRQQVDRLISGKGGERFIKDFAAEWLELKNIDSTEPDRRLVPDFDKIVQRSMLAETHKYLEEMLRENSNVQKLINSDETWLNSRLARYYGIEGVTGDELRKVKLTAQDRRGGLLTHGSVLKVSANGTETSPVVRGVWVAERLMGEHIPPPPSGIPAVEPDTRGSKTIRELLEKHRSDASCASCHVKIDPPGFALENYDPGGKWRDRYVKNGRRNAGLAIDPSYQLPDGRKFRNIREFQSLVSQQPEKLARNLTEKLMTYGTGAPISFADREEVDRIVAQVKGNNYGFRSILHEVTTSPLFLQK